MLVIHSVREGEDQPVCRRPERRDWLWAADPEAVTCASCALQTGVGPARTPAEALVRTPAEARAGAPVERG